MKPARAGNRSSSRARSEKRNQTTTAETRKTADAVEEARQRIASIRSDQPARSQPKAVLPRQVPRVRVLARQRRDDLRDQPRGSAGCRGGGRSRAVAQHDGPPRGRATASRRRSGSATQSGCDASGDHDEMRVRGDEDRDARLPTAASRRSASGSRSGFDGASVIAGLLPQRSAGRPSGSCDRSGSGGLSQPASSPGGRRDGLEQARLVAAVDPEPRR